MAESPPTVTFACPACGARYPWQAEYARRRARCECGMVLQMPAGPHGQPVAIGLDPFGDAPLSIEGPPQGVYGEIIALGDSEQTKVNRGEYELSEELEPAGDPGPAPPVAPGARSVLLPNRRPDDTPAPLDLDAPPPDDDASPGYTGRPASPRPAIRPPRARPVELDDPLSALESAEDVPEAELAEDQEEALPDADAAGEADADAAPPAAPLPSLGPGRCPSCGLSLRPQAVVCLNCGYDLQHGTRLRTALVAAPEATGPAAGADAAAAPADPGPTGLTALRALQGERKTLEERDLDEARLERQALIVNWVAPAVLAVFGVAVMFGNELYYRRGAPSAVLEALLAVGIHLANVVPLMLLACFITAYIMHTEFGGLLPALLKLVAIALTPGALALLVIHLTGGSCMGLIVGVLLALVSMWLLIKWLFDLERNEVHAFVLVTMAVVFGSRLVMWTLWR